MSALLDRPVADIADAVARGATLEHGGRIVEQGSHRELLQRQGAYFTLYNAQFAGAATDVA